MITFEQARELAAVAMHEPFTDYGWEDADDYIVVQVRKDTEPLSVGEQPIIVSKTTGEVRSLFMIENLDRVAAMRPCGHPTS